MFNFQRAPRGADGFCNNSDGSFKIERFSWTVLNFQLPRGDRTDEK